CDARSAADREPDGRPRTPSASAVRASLHCLSGPRRLRGPRLRLDPAPPPPPRVGRRCDGPSEFGTGDGGSSMLGTGRARTILPTVFLQESSLPGHRRSPPIGGVPPPPGP